MKVLYVRGAASEVDDATLAQLRAVAPELDISSVHGTSEALTELRKPGSWQALLVSPTLPQNETLALIASLRRDRTPIAIVPVIDEVQKDVYAAAVASGADDVLLRRGQTLVNVAETLARIQQSPHLFPAEQRRRIGVLYAGRDTLVWNLLEQVPFVKAEKVTCGIDGSCPVRAHGSGDGSLRTDAVVIDEQPGEAHPLQVLKSVKAQASDLPVIVLTSTGSSDIATAALELGADDTVLKTGIFRRRLIATLRRVHQRLELTAQQADTKAREERLRQIVEHVPTGITVIGSDGTVLAMNAAALGLFGADKPRDVVGRDFRQLVASADHGPMTELLRRVTKGDAGSATFTAQLLDGSTTSLTLRGVVLERDAKGGRGVIGSLTRVGADPNPVDDQARAAELASLQGSLERLEKHYAEVEQTRANERTAWNTERRELEERIEAAEKIVAERESLAARLTEVSEELARTSHAFAAERQALENRLQDLESVAREAAHVGTARTELETLLDAGREELRQAVAAHALERSGWQAIREELEARARDLDAAKHAQADQAATLSTLEDQLREVSASLASERDAWSTARADLEAELRHAREALWAEHTDRDSQRSTFEAELSRLRDLLSTERESWASTRSEIEAALDIARREFDEARTKWTAVETRFESDLAEARRLLDAERQAWQDARAALEQRITEAQSAAALEGDRTDRLRELEAERDAARRQLDSERAERNTTLEQTDVEREEARRQLETEREARTQAEARLTAELERTQENARAIAEEYDATRTRLESERDEARKSLTAEREHAASRRSTLDDEVGRLHAEAAEAREVLEALRAQHQELQDGRARLEAERDEAVHRLDREQREWNDQRAGLEAERDAWQRERTGFEAGREEWHRTRARLESDAGDLRQRLDQERLAIEVVTAERDRARHDAADLAAVRRELESARAHTGDLDRERRRDQDTWDTARSALERELDRLHGVLASERQHWQEERQTLTARSSDATRLVHEQQRLETSIEALRSDYAAMVQSLATERAERDRGHHQIEALERELEQAATRHAALERELEQTTHEAEVLIRRRELEHVERVGGLELEISDAAVRLAGVAEEAERSRALLHAEYARAAESHNRLVASDLFGYAVTTLQGELVRCNDAFARMFGFSDAPDAMTRTSGRLFPSLSGRTSLTARLASEGHLDRVESCLDRIDGQPLRVVESLTLLVDLVDRSEGETLVEHVLLATSAGPDAEALQGRRLQEVGALTGAMIPEIEGLVTALHERLSSGVADATETAALTTQIAALVRQLGAFSRRQVRSAEPADLSQAVLRTEPMLVRLAGDYIAFSTDLKTTTTISAPPADLDQLLTSLVTLGRDLLPAGGSIVVETRQSDGHTGLSEDASLGPSIVVTASGYGVQFPDRPSALEQVAERCGGQLQVSGEPGWLVRLEVAFSRCGKTKSGWEWIRDGEA